MKNITFAYRLPAGSRVPGFGRDEINTVMAMCSPREKEGYDLSYAVTFEGAGSGLYGDFDEELLSNVPQISVEEIDVIIRTSIESRLLRHKMGILERDTSPSVMTFPLFPNPALRDRKVRLKVECYYPRAGVYFVVLCLIYGRKNLGILGARQMSGKAISPEELYHRVQVVAEALLPDDLEEVIEDMVQQNKKVRDDSL